MDSTSNSDLAQRNPEYVERWIITKLADLLGTGYPGFERTQALSECGANSVVIACLAGELETLLGRRVSVDVLYENPTIAELAEHLTSNASIKGA